MSIATATRERTFVVCHVGNRNFALSAEQIVELAPPVRLHTFSHTTPHIAGVIVRRGCIVSVHDTLAPIKAHSSAHRFYLIAKRASGGAYALGAIPVDGECQMVVGEMLPVEPDRPRYVCGSLKLGAELLDVLDFDALIASRLPDSEAIAAQEGNRGAAS